MEDQMYLIDRVHAVLLDASCPQAAERRISDTFKVETAGFVVQNESDNYVKVTYQSNRPSGKIGQAALETYKAVLNTAGFRTHLSINGWVLVGDAPKKIERDTTPINPVVEYPKEDIQQWRNTLMLEAASMFANGTKRAYANHLVEAWTNNTDPMIGHSFGLTQKGVDWVYNKMYTIYTMDDCQVARVYKYSRPNIDWTQTSTKRG